MTDFEHWWYHEGSQGPNGTDLEEHCKRMCQIAWSNGAYKEREACAAIADRLPRIYRETEEAHYRLSPDPFKPSQFGFDFAELRQAEAITHAIRARGQK